MMSRFLAPVLSARFMTLMTLLLVLLLGMLFSPAVGPLYLPAVGPLFLPAVGPLFLPAVGPLFCHPSRCSGPQVLCLLVDSPLTLTELLASCLQHHPVWSCSLAPLTPPSARCACRERCLFEILPRDVALSSSSLAVIMARHEPPTMALHGSPASLHASPCFDKLFARPRADPRVLFLTILQSSAALARRAGWFAGLTSTTCVPSSHCAWRSLFPRHRDHSSSCSGDQPEYECNRASRVSPRPPGHDPAEALSRLSAAVANALGHVPHGQWALLDADMPLLIDRSACLVEPVAVELLLLPCLCCHRSKHDRRRVWSPLTKLIARPPCRRTCPPPSCSL